MREPFILSESKDFCIDFTDLNIFSMLYREYSAKDISLVLGVNPSGICVRIRKLDKLCPSKTRTRMQGDFHPAVTVENYEFLAKCDDTLKTFYGENIIYKDSVELFELKKKDAKLQEVDDENNFGRARECGFLGPGD